MTAKSVLLVDDSKSARFFLRNLLKHLDIEVEMAETGEQALEMLKKVTPDIVFMDHLMPGIDGFETTQAIKSNPSTAHIPVVMCTSNEGEDYIREAKSIGAFGILPKPPTEAKVKEVLQAIATAPTAPEAAPAVGLNREQIAAIAREVAEEVVQTGLETQVRQIVHGLTGKIEADLKAASESVAREIASELIARSREDIEKALAHSTAELVESRLAKVAGNTSSATDSDLGGRMEEAGHMLAEQAAKRLEKFSADFQSERDQFLRDATEAAKRTAEQAATKAAEGTASAIASRVARETSELMGRAGQEDTVKHLVTEQTKTLSANVASLQTQVKTYAAVAAGAGALIAILVSLIL